MYFQGHFDTLELKQLPVRSVRGLYVAKNPFDSVAIFVGSALLRLSALAGSFTVHHLPQAPGFHRARLLSVDLRNASHATYLPFTNLFLVPALHPV